MKVAESQYGLITRAQATEVMSPSAVDRRLARGAWVVVHPGVYRIAGAPVTPRQRACAATLWVPGSAVSHAAAARLLRLPDIPGDGLDLTVPPGCGVRSGELRIHHSSLKGIDRVVVDGIPCTSATRTLIDCGCFVDGETLETAFEHARRLGLTSVRAVERQLGRGRPGSSAMRDVLAHASVRPNESRLEVKVARLLRLSPLPRPSVQFEIREYRVDFAWRRERIVCECDGFAWHGNRLQWKRDRRRLATIEALGWRVVRVTWDDVTIGRTKR